MNKTIKFSLALVAMTGLLAGCALLSRSGPQAPPTRLEQSLFTVSTNLVPKTNIIFAPLTNPATGIVSNAPVATNIGTTTNYGFGSSPTQQAVIGTAGAIGSLFGFGGVVTTLLGGLFGLWGNWRSRQATVTAGTLAQIVETARQLISSTPQGAQMGAAFKSWMMEHQTDAGVINSVAALVDSAVSPDAATGAASSILALMQSTGPAPVAANLVSLPIPPNPTK